MKTYKMFLMFMCFYVDSYIVKFFESPIIFLVGAVLIKDNNIILARRSKNLTNFPNLFEFPGGKVEKVKHLKKH